MLASLVAVGGFAAAVALRIYVAYRFIRDPQMPALVRRTRGLSGAL